MEFVNLFDSHTHSHNSFDGEDAVFDLCESARRRQLMGLCITDHYDCQLPQQRCGVRIRNSVLETAKTKNFLGNSLMLTTGIELGEATRNFAEAQAAVGQFRFDFVLGSLHSDRESEDYYFVDFRQVEVDALLRRYYQEMLELCRWGQFDVLAHLTYPLRYICGKYRLPVDLDAQEELIREILCTLIRCGRGIELNTAGLRQGLGETSPPLRYLKLYRQLGGEIVTIGSDAHRSGDIGAGIREGMELLREAGFSYFAFYKDRQPRMLRLI